ncbi:cupin domain-containing protein [bacterium]|nr:cupin domain-containing protein [bacterium]
MESHIEGGWFRELYRSMDRVRHTDGRDRNASTAIHYLLTGGSVCRWHRVQSDELWHFCEGQALELHEIPADLSRHTVHRLASSGGEWFRVIPAGCWQAARSTGGFTLVTCVVAPGFEYADFRLLSEEPALRDRIVHRYPGVETFL